MGVHPTKICFLNKIIKTVISLAFLFYFIFLRLFRFMVFASDENFLSSD